MGIFLTPGQGTPKITESQAIQVAETNLNIQPGTLITADYLMMTTTTVHAFPPATVNADPAFKVPPPLDGKYQQADAEGVPVWVVSFNVKIAFMGGPGQEVPRPSNWLHVAVDASTGDSLFSWI